MKAVVINQYGGNEVIEINTEVAKPVASKGQVLVEVKSASVNPVDYKIMQGYMKDMLKVSFPLTLGGDFAGVVSEVGDDVSDFKKGDEVYGQAIVFNGGSGSFAEFLVNNASNTSIKPKNTTMDEAAALPLVGASAVQALIDYIKLSSGQKILIQGGAGGIGHVAIQIAKALGAYVATTVSPIDVEFAKQLGADEVIDYKNEQFEEKLKEFDAVFDTVGGETTNKSFKVLKKGGVLVSMVGKPDEKMSQEYQVTGIGQFTSTDIQHLKKLTEFVENGKVKIKIDKVFPLDSAKEAIELAQNHPKGKVVLHIQ